MIQQITAFSPEDTAILEQSWRGRQMLAYQQAYGGGYDFCRFFRATGCGGTGWLFLFNATLLICQRERSGRRDPHFSKCTCRLVNARQLLPVLGRSQLSKAAPCNIPADASDHRRRSARMK
ncbi:MAG: hypothetical protein ACLR5S_11745 [Ruminococcus sp.]